MIQSNSILWANMGSLHVHLFAEVWLDIISEAGSASWQELSDYNNSLARTLDNITSRYSPNSLLLYCTLMNIPGHRLENSEPDDVYLTLNMVCPVNQLLC